MPVSVEQQARGAHRAARRGRGEHDGAHLVERLVARSHGVALSEMMAPGRATARAKWARHTTMYLQRVVLQLSCETIAARFGHHRTSVVHACRKVEERRDEAAFDARLQTLEMRIGRRLEEAPR